MITVPAGTTARLTTTMDIIRTSTNWSLLSSSNLFEQVLGDGMAANLQYIGTDSITVAIRCIAFISAVNIGSVQVDTQIFANGTNFVPSSAIDHPLSQIITTSASSLYVIQAQAQLDPGHFVSWNMDAGVDDTVVSFQYGNMLIEQIS
jgi:hypothetical protein